MDFSQVHFNIFIMKGIELFKQGANSNLVNFKEEIFEFIIETPSFYLQFLKLVYNNKFSRIEFNICKIKEDEILKPLQIVYHGDIEKREFLTLENFFIPRDINSYVDKDGLKYLVIAASEDPGKGGVLVGVDTGNVDKIYKYRWEESDMLPDQTKLLAENIFDFIKDLKTLEMWEEKYDRDLLWKNYKNSYYQLR